MERTEIAQLGEFGLIDRLNQKIKNQLNSTTKGIGDDAAVLDYGAPELCLMASDMLVEGVHFDLSYVPLKHLGYKAVAVNVSDIVAMNGTPKHLTISLGLSNRFSVEAIEELYEGVHFACQEYNVDLVGGDTTSSPKGLIMSISITGTVGRDKVSYRNGAKENDILCVTGDLGGAYLGLQIMEREKQVFSANPEMQPELEGKEYIIQRQLKPIARTDVVFELQDLGIVPSSMIDISDGLASELWHICTQSGVGAVVFEDKLPIDEASMLAAQELNLDTTMCAMNGGEDYELLLTIKQSDFEKLKNNPNITPIGYILPQASGIILKTLGGNEVPIEAQGWNHFEKSN